ncbi:DNA polymerase Y family protein [Fodinibius sediminis]|uniref:DNA polymerase-4 n=1 Tax=Fodinibius sediminis TaxID=1214077 RepID=A0A521E4D6_9BACT|nr:DNA polymerase IV [Fodinibius sediminis]SMO78796.1 DNA polymerase-4 [Fodinibius sediminis]
MMIGIEPGTYDVHEDVHKITDYRCVSRDMQHTSMEPRLYLHVDMNCFYAQVEQLCYNLYGMPLYVGGWYKPDGTPRGIVATSSYEARAFGVKTGMSAYEAEKICPYLVGVQADYKKYEGMSRLVREVLQGFAMDVEKYSMDEYFIDINFLKDASRAVLEDYAHRLKHKLYDELHLVCSIGIARSKTYAKLASDLRKPRGITIVYDEEDAAELIYPLPLDEVWGIGNRRYAKLRKEGLITIADGLERGYPLFQKQFGEYFGKIVYEMIAGKDRARVLTEESPPPELLNYMHTFSDWTKNPDKVEGEIMKGIQQLCYRMRGYGVKADKYFCYLRVQDQKWSGDKFRFNTAGRTNLDDYIYRACMKQARPRMARLLANGFALRGVGLGTLELDRSHQQELFFSENKKMRQFYLAQDAINNEYGKGTIQKASMKYGVEGKTHFLERS